MKIEENSVRFSPEGKNEERLTWIYKTYDRAVKDVKDDYALDFFADRKEENANFYGIGLDSINNINKYYSEITTEENSHIIKAIRQIDGKLDYRVYIKKQNKKYYKAYPSNSKFEKVGRAFAFYYSLTADFLSEDNITRIANKRNLDVSEFLANSQERLFTWAMASKSDLTIYYLDKKKVREWI